MQYSISQSDNNACDILIEYAGGIKHINDYIHRLSIDSSTSETEDGMHSSFEAVAHRNWSTPSAMVRLLRTAGWKRVVLQQGAERLLVADHDRYWNRCQQTERYVASQTVVGQRSALPTAMPTVWKLQIMMPASLSFPTAGNTTLPLVMDSYETDEDNANIARISRMVYDAMRWERQGGYW